MSSIVLNGGSTPVPIDSGSVYFTFADGRLHYDCQACGATCCRGHGYELQVGRELESHLSSSASVRFFLDRCSAVEEKHYHAANWKPGCFFLTDSHHCGIQVQHGYDSKPETCRLFPFNHLVRVGSHLIVGPHRGLCPLSVVPAGRWSECSSHEALLGGLTRTPINLHVPSAPSIDVPPDALVALERRVVAASEDHLAGGNYGDFVASQALMTREALESASGPEGDVALPVRNVQHFEESLYRILGPVGAAPAKEPGSVSAMMTAATPTLRAELLFASSRASSGPDVSLALLPYALLALYGLALRAHEAGMHQVTYQSLIGLLRQYRPLIVLLAHVNTVVVWRPTATVHLSMRGDVTPPATIGHMARALGSGIQSRKRIALVDVLECVLPREHDLARVILLKSLARDLYGKIVPIERYRAPTLLQRLRNPRPTAQRWLIGNVPDAVLVAVAQKNQRISRAGTARERPDADSADRRSEPLI